MTLDQDTTHEMDQKQHTAAINIITTSCIICHFAPYITTIVLNYRTIQPVQISDKEMND